MWNQGWNTIFQDNIWGHYPPEEVIRFMARQYGDLASREDVKVLEVGCGPGANIWYLSREGYDAYGIDGSDVAIQQAGERLSAQGLTANLSVGDVVTLPYENDMFDSILDIECIYANSLKDTKKIIQEVYRVLKPGGLFFSKTFMVGTYGDGKGTLLEGERHTYEELSEGALHKGYGIIRFTSEEEIETIYQPFKVQNIDYLIRSQNNRAHEVKEWLITCKKEL